MEYQDKVDLIHELVESKNEYVLLLDDFGDALIGYDVTDGSIPTPIYDKNKMVDILVERDHMEKDEAIEYIEYNVFNALPQNDNHYPRIISIF